jgi:hypothetical protein
MHGNVVEVLGAEGLEPLDKVFFGEIAFISFFQV